MLRRTASLLLLLAGLALLGAAGYGYVTFRVGPAVRPDSDEVDAGPCVVGEEAAVAFRFRNHSGHPVRILGLTVC